MVSSSRKKSESLCKKCAKKPDCSYKINDGDIALVRCLDFTVIEIEEKK